MIIPPVYKVTVQFGALYVAYMSPHRRTALQQARREAKAGATSVTVESILATGQTVLLLELPKRLTPRVDRRRRPRMSP